MKRYRITYAWACGDLTKEVSGANEKEALDVFYSDIYSNYNPVVLRAACFKVINIAEE